MIRPLLAVVLAGLASSAAARESFYTPLQPAECTRLTKTPPNRMGDHELDAYRCRGPNGRVLYLDFHGNTVTVAIGRAGQPKPPAQIQADYNIGPRVEWRGERKGGGVVADAAIVRLARREDTARTATALGVFRVEGDRICTVAVVDAAEQPNANELARQAADTLAPAFRCGVDGAKVFGKETARANEFLERLLAR